jgi:hypothetical protein
MSRTKYTRRPLNIHPTEWETAERIAAQTDAALAHDRGRREIARL